MAPGAADLAVATQLSGSFRQSAGATSDFELDFGSDVIDSVVATGTVELDGALDVSLMNTALVRPGTYEKVLYYGAGGLKDNGLAMFAQPSIVIAYELLFPDARTAALGYDVDFAPAGLVGNRIAIGDYVNRVQGAGSTAAIGDTITALVAQTELDPHSNLLTQLGPEFYAEQQAYTLGSVQRFARKSMRAQIIAPKRKFAPIPMSIHRIIISYKVRYGESPALPPLCVLSKSTVVSDRSLPAKSLCL